MVKMNPTFKKLFLLVKCCFITAVLSAQNYFKILEDPQGSYFQYMAAFPNGDLLIGDKVHDPNQPFAAKHTYLIRLDECGEVVWANTYQSTDRQIDFEKVAISENGIIYVMTNALDNSGGDFQVSLLKIAGDGTLLDARLYRIIDYKFQNNYSLQVKGDRVMILKWFEDTNHFSYSHLIVLDQDLNLLFSKKIAPYAAYGEAILTSDQGVLYFSGNTLVKTDKDGGILWTKEVGGVNSLSGFTVPLEVQDGYVYGVYQLKGAYTFFKISKTGQLLWQSKDVPAFYFVPQLQLLSSGTIFVLYNSSVGTNNVPAFLTITPDGELSEQQRLQVDFQINTGFTYCRLTDDYRVNVLGNVQMKFPRE